MAENIETNGMELVLSSQSQEENRTNLIVNYLPATVTQKDVQSIFSSIGQLESCRLIRDKQTAQSLGYGFVNYYKPEDAEQAVRDLNGLKLQNKTLKVSYARPSSKSMKFSNVYVNGLPRNYTQEDLLALFSPYGTIIDSKILVDKTANDNVHSFVSGVPEVLYNSKGVGFVRFNDHTEAERAITELNGATLEGTTSPITVKFANSPSSAVKPMNNNVIHNDNYSYYHYETVHVHTHALSNCAGNYEGPFAIFVYNLSPDIEVVDLWKLFGPYGAVQDVKIVRDLETNLCKGYAFVSMLCYDQALMAVRSINGSVLNDRILQVSFKTNKKAYLT